METRKTRWQKQKLLLCVDVQFAEENWKFLAKQSTQWAHSIGCFSAIHKFVNQIKSENRQEKIFFNTNQGEQKVREQEG